MTELSSQMWSRSLEERFMTPPWLKVVAVEPQTGHALPNGSVGRNAIHRFGKTTRLYLPLKPVIKDCTQ